MVRSAVLRFLPVFVALFGLGCQPKIGDECITDLDCSQAGDRICDTTQPDGYCTQVDCDPFSCPEKESVCVAFSNSASNVGVCNAKDGTSPYRRTFCMATCEEDADCRAGYSCLDVSEDNPWGAQVIQEDAKRATVCILSMSYEEVDEDRSDEVCRGSDVGAGGAGGAGN